MKFKIALADGGTKDVEGVEFSKNIDDCPHDFIVHKSDTSIGYAVSHRGSGLRVSEIPNHLLAICLGDKIAAAVRVVEKMMNGLGEGRMHAILAALS